MWGLGEASINVSKYTEPTYLDNGRWASYRELIREIMRINPRRILEIGPGSKVVSGILGALGFKVYTLDINQAIKPDIVGSVAALPIKRESVDLIVAQQVLEHLPFDAFAGIVSDMYAVANAAIISIPHLSLHLTIGVKVPLLGWRVMCVTAPIAIGRVSREHCWELGKTVKVREVRRRFVEAGFEIEKSFRTPEHPYHHFFVLRKRAQISCG